MTSRPPRLAGPRLWTLLALVGATLASATALGAGAGNPQNIRNVSQSLGSQAQHAPSRRAKPADAGTAAVSEARHSKPTSPSHDLVVRTRKAWEAASGHALDAREASHLRTLLRRGYQATLEEAKAHATRGEARVAVALLDAAKELRGKTGESLAQSDVDAVASLVAQNVQGTLTTARQASRDIETDLDQARSDLRAVGLSLTHEAVEFVRNTRKTAPEEWTRSSSWQAPPK